MRNKISLHNKFEKVQIIKYILEAYTIIDVIYSFYIIEQTNQAALKDGVDISSIYVKAVLFNTVVLIIMSASLFLKSYKGPFVAVIMGGLLLYGGFNKLAVEWQEAQIFFEGKISSRIFATLLYWWEYHNGAQEIPRLIIVLWFTIFSIYLFITSFKSRRL